MQVDFSGRIMDTGLSKRLKKTQMAEFLVPPSPQGARTPKIVKWQEGENEDQLLPLPALHNKPLPFGPLSDVAEGSGE